MKGIIALDIDGTITVDHHDIAPEVVNFLSSLIEEGWKLIFITGRTFLWGYAVLKKLNLPYYFAMQNGAIILEMPTRRLVSKKYIDTSIFPLMEEICANEPTDFVIYTGFEYRDHCYYRPKHFAADIMNYLHRRVEGLDEIWTPLSTFDDLPIKEFPSIKCFGHKDSANRIAQEIEEKIGLHVPLVGDPFQTGYYVVQATHLEVNKGYAVKDFKKIIGLNGPVIAAGDDNNDRPMLDVADIKVVMGTAPEDMRHTADVVAPPAAKLGIIQGLKEAIALCQS